MHEFSLVKDLIGKISDIARGQRASKVIGVKVKLGALAHISPEHFREHFIHASRGTAAEGAQLNIEILTDANDPQSREVRLESIEVIDSLA
jgi:hydrogenase nickel incorporation protein HypA/HybF